MTLKLEKKQRKSVKPSLLFEKYYQIDKSSGLSLIKIKKKEREKRQKTQITKIRNERRDNITDPKG